MTGCAEPGGSTVFIVERRRMDRMECIFAVCAQRGSRWRSSFKALRTRNESGAISFGAERSGFALKRTHFEMASRFNSENELLRDCCPSPNRLELLPNARMLSSDDFNTFSNRDGIDTMRSSRRWTPDLDLRSLFGRRARVRTIGNGDGG